LPTYSYKCTECGTAFDIYQEFTDSTLTECPNCGGKLRKVFSAVGVTFNGSGFYRNDSRATKTTSDAPAKSSASSESSTPSVSSPAKSDSKPSTPTQSGKAASPKATAG
jgi:putative FmdB family regulatory protein